MSLPPELTIPEVIKAGATAAFGGLSYVLYQVSKGEKFNVWRIIIVMILAFFVGTVMSQFVPDVSYKGGLLAISGYCALPILAILEKIGPDILTKYIK